MAQPPEVIPLILNVYKPSGFLSQDQVITSSVDKNAILYYAHIPTSFMRGWSCTLHRGGIQGPIICSIVKVRLRALPPTLLHTLILNTMNHRQGRLGSNRVSYHSVEWL